MSDRHEPMDTPSPSAALASTLRQVASMLDQAAAVARRHNRPIAQRHAELAAEQARYAAGAAACESLPPPSRKPGGDLTTAAADPPEATPPAQEPLEPSAPQG